MSAKQAVALELFSNSAVLVVVLQRYYIPSARELQRIESVSRSPIYSKFSEALAGVPTIRAYRKERYFTVTSDKLMQENAYAYISQRSAASWLAMRLDVVGVLILTLTGGWQECLPHASFTCSLLAGSCYSVHCCCSLGSDDCCTMFAGGTLYLYASFCLRWLLLVYGYTSSQDELQSCYPPALVVSVLHMTCFADKDDCCCSARCVVHSRHHQPRPSRSVPGVCTGPDTLPEDGHGNGIQDRV